MNRKSGDVFEHLRSEIESPESLLIDMTDQDSYFHDATEFRAVPSAILMAQCQDDIVAAVHFCRENSIPIAPRGAGTGLSGGCVPTDNALVVSTERIDHLEIRSNEKTAICGPGVITKDLLDAATACGLDYPPDPASYAESTLGGNVAEGAGGLRCKRFGVTKDYIIGLRAVLSDGSILNTGIFNENRGFPLGDILIGSEGTLAIITEIALRLIKASGQGNTILAAFNDTKHAAQTVSDITTAGIIPSVLEFLDGDAAQCSNQYEPTEGLDRAAAILLIETSDRHKESQTEAIEHYCRANHCTVLRLESDHERSESLWKVRRNLSNATKEAAIYRISEDIVVPNSKFPALVEFIGKMNRQSELRINCYGHAGDGNLHVNFLYDSDSPDQMARLEGEIECLMRKTMELGGTLSGEHGIGLAKRKYLPWEFDDPTIDTMWRIKSAFDPENLLNPNKLLTSRC
jgi:glycolate oxidase subunit GlcD